MRAYDMVIIGGGICGLTAAIYAARSNFSVCVLEKDVCGGLVNWTYCVENIPSHRSINGMAFMKQCREQAEALGVDIFEIDAVTGVDFTGPLKRIATADGERFSARAVIAATGRKPLPIPVATDYPNVHYCSICDGTAYKGKDVLVIGGGNSGFDESLYLIGLGVKSVLIVECFPRCVADEATQRKAAVTGRIGVRVSTRVLSVDPAEEGRAIVRLEDSLTGDTASVTVDGIFCFIGQKPNSELFAGVLELEDGYIKVSPNMETTVPGVFAAGDVIVKKYRQITTAMGDGTIAALQAGHYLRNGESR